MKRKGQSAVGLGAASLIMILLVLCLSLMGILSLMSARAELNLSRRHAQLAAQYAEASAKAQEALAKLDEQLMQIHETSADEAAYMQGCMEIDSVGEAQVEWEETKAVLFVDAGQARTLQVELELKNWENAPEQRFSVTGYQLVDSNEWVQTDGLILMDLN